MLVDANILLYAADETSPFHSASKSWLEGALNGSRRVALPWQSLLGFLRIATNPRALGRSLSTDEAWGLIEDWLTAPCAWIPQPTAGYGTILGRLVCDLRLSGNLIPDAALAALCIQHGLAIVSADSDFARFPELTWINPAV